MNFYKHHIGDYAKKTGALTMLQHGAYCLLLHAYYGTEKPLPHQDLYKICRANTKKERESVDQIVTRFWHRTETGWVNTRADEEIEKAQRLRELAKENGSQGGRPAKAVSKPNGFQNHNPAGSGKKPSGLHSRLQTPDSTNQIPEKDSKTGGEEKPRAARSAAPSRLPDDFDLTEDRYAYALGKGVEPESTFEAFRAYWHAKPKDNTKLDWDLTWQSWVLREAKDRRERTPPRKTRFEQAMEQIDGD